MKKSELNQFYDLMQPRGGKWVSHSFTCWHNKEFNSPGPDDVNDADRSIWLQNCNRKLHENTVQIVPLWRQISCYCSHSDNTIITINKRKQCAKLIMEKKQELNKSGSGFSFHFMISIFCDNNGRKIHEVGFCWRESWLFYFYINVIENLFYA